MAPHILNLILGVRQWSASLPSVLALEKYTHWVGRWVNLGADHGALDKIFL
jgi:hypothetical protein